MRDLAGIWADVAEAAHKGLAGMLAELGGTGVNQHTRLLRLHTPLGPEVLLAERVTITETFSPGASWLPTGAEPPHGTGLLTGFGMDLLAVSTRADLHAPELLGQPVLLELLTAASLTQLRPFHGHVTRFELLGSDGGLARYRLHIEPWTAFLAQRTDAWVFQDMSVLDITEAVFADYMQQGRLMPQWRIDVGDRAAFAKRSLCTQFNETDLAFLQRLWAEEGLFTWFEHQGAPQDARTLGAHTLMIADHNDAFQPNAQSRIRYTQPGTVLKEDSITRWHGHRRVDSSAVQTASWDYRTVSSHTASAEADAAHEQPMRLAHTDQPGAYAYETPAQAEQDMVAPMWEHIRRFMEAGGPHLPSPGESLDGRTEGHITWWEACGEAGPFGSRYGWWWKNHPFMTLFVYHGLVLIGVGMFLLPLILHGTFGGVFALMAVWIALSINWGMGTGKWLLANTSVQVNWPQAVVDAVGRTIRIGPGWGRNGSC